MTASPIRLDPADWTTMWQSELAATAVDREFGEGLSAAAELWNLTALANTQQPPDDPPGPPQSDASPRPAPADAAPGDGSVPNPTRRQPGRRTGKRKPPAA